jgi:hypothetical protein
MVRKHQTSDAQLRIGESRDSGFDAGAGHWARTSVVRLAMPTQIRGYLLLVMRACQTMIIMSQRSVATACRVFYSCNRFPGIEIAR